MEELSDLHIDESGDLVDNSWMPLIEMMEHQTKNKRWYPIFGEPTRQYTFADIKDNRYKDDPNGTFLKMERDSLSKTVAKVNQKYLNRGRKRLRAAMRIAFNWRQPIPNY